MLEIQESDKEAVVNRPAKRVRYDVWSSLINKRTVIQQKGGIIITGILIGHRDGFFVLEDASVIGRKTEVKPPRLLVERFSVAHMHEQCPLQPLADTPR